MVFLKIRYPGISPFVRLLIANSAHQVAARGIVSLTTFILTLFIARTLGTRGYGDFIIVTTYIPLFFILADAGLNAMYIRDISTTISKKIGSFEELLSTRLLWSLILLAVSLAGIVPLSYALPDLSLQALLLLLIYSPAIVSQSVLTTCNAEFQKDLRYRYQTASLLTGSALTLTVAGLSLFLKPDNRLPVIIAGLGAGSFVTAFRALDFIRASGVPLSVRISFTRLAAHLKLATPLILTLVFNVVYFKADMFILSSRLGQEAVGVYGYAYKFFELFLVIPTFAMNSVYPTLSRLWNQQGKITARKNAVGSVFLVLLLLSLGTALAGQIVALLIPLIGPEFSGSRGVLQILSAGIPLFFLTSLSMWLLVLSRLHSELVAIYLSAFIINVTLNLVFIPVYSYPAAAWITLATEAYTGVVSWAIIMSRKTIYG